MNNNDFTPTLDDRASVAEFVASHDAEGIKAEITRVGSVAEYAADKGFGHAAALADWRIGQLVLALKLLTLY